MDDAKQELREAATKDGIVCLWWLDEDDDNEILASYLQFLGDQGVVVLQ